MKYISIDIETTGLDREVCQILSVGAVIEDTNNPLPLTELPTFHCAIKRSSVYGELYALNMNKDLIESIVQYQTAKDQDEKNDLVQMTGMLFLDENEVVDALFRFCYDNGMVEVDTQLLDLNKKVRLVDGKTYPILSTNMDKVYLTVAGKNFATFDKIFLERLPRWKQVFNIRQRIIDPSILFTDWESDESLPSLLQCKQRAGILGEVTHNAVEDAMDIIQILRTQYVTPKNK
jgi:oligoribonuclease (3'-5' exoribonuclease)